MASVGACCAKQAGHCDETGDDDEVGAVGYSGWATLWKTTPSDERTRPTGARLGMTAQARGEARVQPIRCMLEGA